MHEPEATRLRSAIGQAFQSVPMPSEENIRETHGRHFDEAEIRKRFAQIPE